MSGVIEAVRNVFRGERLEDLPMRHIDPFRPDFLGWLLGRESLPRDEVPTVTKAPAFLSWLLASEELAEAGDAPSPSGQARFLESLFAGEELPLDEKPEKAGGRGATPPARNQRAG